MRTAVQDLPRPFLHHEDVAMNETKTRVRFLGGPYDGLEFTTACAYRSLAPVAELPVSQDVLWALSGRLLRRKASVKAVAVYAICPEKALVPYQFVKLRPVRADELAGLDNWCNYVIRSEALRADQSVDESKD
jgi:hypothetical protein